MRRSALTATVAWALMIGGVPSSVSARQATSNAASQPSISVGDTVRGALDETDPVGEEGVPFDGYRFSGRAGQKIVVTLRSDAFDAYLGLRGPDGDRLTEDDDGAGEGTHARLGHTLETDGDYVIEARAFGAGETGDYVLTLAETAPEPSPLSLVFGRTVSGSIGEGDPVDDEGRPFDAFSFSGVAGQRVQLVMRSGDFDTFVQIGAAGGAFTALAGDDDGLREGTDSRLIHTLPATGDYVARALPLAAGDSGLYALELVDRGPQPNPGSLLVGSTARGVLSEDDAIGDEGAVFDAYRFTAKAGEDLRITLVSNDFDAVLTIGTDPGDGAFEALATDDDSLSDTHAMLEWTAEVDGTHVILANAFEPGQYGAYALTVERKP